MAQQVRTQVRTKEQQKIVDDLTHKFDIDGSRILFLNSKDPLDPWIPSSELEAIARQIGGLQQSEVEFYQYVEPLKQVHYKATVIDQDGKWYVRTGAAKLDEQSKGGELDADTLAQGRALSNALRAAGFHPLKSGSIVSLEERRAFTGRGEARPLSYDEQQEQQQHHAHDAAAQRTNDLKRIHALASERGLIQFRPGLGKDDSGYREWLRRNFSVHSAAELDAYWRMRVITELETYDEDNLEMIA